MTEKLDIRVVAAQAEAVFGAAEGLEQNLDNVPEDLHEGMLLAAKILKATAEGMMLEALFQQ